MSTILHPAWNHESPLAYAVAVPDCVSMRFDHYGVFITKEDASFFVDEVAQEVFEQLGREATDEELTIYPLHAVLNL